MITLRFVVFRSWLPGAQLGMTIDNGNHLVLSGNRAVQDYLKRIGASDRLAGPDKAVFAFFDLRDGARWRMRPSDGRIPWWIFQKDRRVPGTRAVSGMHSGNSPRTTFRQ